jgi:alpha-tubulin suppressor-like RCC1 family protein
MGLGTSLLLGFLGGAAYAASGSVTPGTVTHSQRVHVTWSGMAARMPIFIQQCDNVINTNPSVFDQTTDCSSLTQQAIDGQTFNASGSGESGDNLATDPDFKTFVGLEPSTFQGWGCSPSGSPTGVSDGSGNLLYNPCTIRVSDNTPNGPTNSFFLTLTLAAPSGTLPVFTADSPPTSVVNGSQFSYTFAASGSPAPSFNWVFGTAGPFLSLNTATGQLQGTPTQNGSYTFRVQADNTAGGTLGAIHTLLVGTPPSFTADSPPSSMTVGTAYSYAYAATGSPAPTFSVTSGTLPTGLSIDPNTGVLSGTPTTAGSFTFTVSASNGVGSPATTPSTTITVVTGGSVLAGGDNGFGQLCNGTTAGTSTATQAVPPANANVTSVAAGAVFSLALRSDGTVLSCGRNNFGQLGNGTTNDSSTPVAVSMPGGVKATAIAANGYHGLALTSTGAVYGWGYNAFGQLGDGTTTNRLTPIPVALPGGTTVTAISAGWSYSLALTSSGSVLAWGWNAEGELGDGTGVQRLTPVAVLAPATGVTAISAGSNHNLALRSDGTVLSWGLNNFGQVGDATFVSRMAPVPVLLPPGQAVTAIAAGGAHSLAVLRSNGTVLAWGWNRKGQLGDGTQNDRSTPVAVALPGGATVTSLAGGYQHSLALTSAGAILAWGSNASGQLLDGTTVDRPSPVFSSPPATTGVFSLSAGWSFSLLAKP